MKLHCSNGCTPPFKTESFERQPHETHCDQPGCDGRLLTGMERNARKKASRNNGRLREQSDAESRAAEEFHAKVCEEGCWAKYARPGHVCRGPVQSHHIIEAQWWRRVFGDLDEEALLRLIYNPLIGAPSCGGFHAEITPRVGGKRDHIFFTELYRELIEHCERLDLEYPGRGVLIELERQCPKRSAVA
jgi:hypothetical protein